MAESDETSDDKMLAKGKKLFALCVDRENENRQNYIDDVKFGRLGGNEQWPSEIVTQRQNAGLPCLTINQMPMFIHQVINDCRQNKPAISVRPVDSGADRQTAQVLAGGFRHIENISNADVAYDTAVDNAASGNVGYARVVVDYAHDDSFDKEIYIRAVPDSLTIYGDPYSMSADSLDWNDAFILDWVPEDEFRDQYPDAKTSDFADGAMQWKRDGEVLKCEWWHRDETEREIVLLSNGWVLDAAEYDEDKAIYDAQGLTEKDRRTTRSWKITQRIMTGAEILETNDHPGKYIPIAPCYGEVVVVEGKRHLRSLIRDGKDPQRNYNYWRSKSAESAALATKNPFIGPEKAFSGDDADKWATANTVNHPYLSYPDDTPSPPQRQGWPGINPAELQQAASANDDIRATIGIQNAALGQQSNETSGRAINARKVESDTATFHFTDNLSRMIRCLGIIILDLMPHVYTPGRFMRVLGQDGKENFAQIGSKPSQPQIGAQPMPTQLPTPNPNQEKDEKPDYGAIYDIGLGNYDVVVSAGPGYTTKRQEAADQMLQLVQSDPRLAPIIGDLIAENLDWPGADEIARRLKLLLPPQLQQDPNTPGLPPQLMQKIQQGQQLIQQLMAALHQCQAELQAAKNDNSVDQMKIEVEKMGVAVDAFNAQTQRLEAETKRGEALVGAFQGTAGVPGSPRPSFANTPVNQLAS